MSILITVCNIEALFFVIIVIEIKALYSSGNVTVHCKCTVYMG